MTNKERLLNLFDRAIKNAGQDSCIVITVRTRIACKDYDELIVLRRELWEFKRDYYSKAYNDDLVLNNAEFVSIISASIMNGIGFLGIEDMEMFHCYKVIDKEIKVNEEDVVNVN